MGFNRWKQGVIAFIILFFNQDSHVTNISVVSLGVMRMVKSFLAVVKVLHKFLSDFLRTQTDEHYCPPVAPLSSQHLVPDIAP